MSKETELRELDAWIAVHLFRRHGENMTDLFPIPPSPSPRLAWMAKHDLHTHCSGAAKDFLGEPWNCWRGDLKDATVLNDDYATGATEIDAIVAWAKAHGVKLWNEE